MEEKAPPELDRVPGEFSTPLPGKTWLVVAAVSHPLLLTLLPLLLPRIALIPLVFLLR